ncbi:MAG: hypothetical protein AVDCRST_MAG65-799, partial [uncultured Solirubrobacteraceae bacterium]
AEADPRPGHQAPRRLLVVPARHVADRRHFRSRCGRAPRELEEAM